MSNARRLFKDEKQREKAEYVPSEPLSTREWTQCQLVNLPHDSASEEQSNELRGPIYLLVKLAMARVDADSEDVLEKHIAQIAVEVGILKQRSVSECAEKDRYFERHSYKPDDVRNHVRSRASVARRADGRPSVFQRPPPTARCRCQPRPRCWPAEWAARAAHHHLPSRRLSLAE